MLQELVAPPFLKDKKVINVSMEKHVIYNIKTAYQNINITVLFLYFYYCFVFLFNVCMCHMLLIYWGKGPCVMV